MDKKEKKDMPQTDTQPRPNRDAYKKAFSEDYPDMDFEDKETRYGRMLEDRNSLRSYRKSGAALNGLFENQRWLAAMVSDLMDNPDLNLTQVRKRAARKNRITDFSALYY